LASSETILIPLKVRITIFFSNSVCSPNKLKLIQNCAFKIGDIQITRFPIAALPAPMEDVSASTLSVACCKEKQGADDSDDTRDLFLSGSLIPRMPPKTRHEIERYL